MSTESAESRRNFLRFLAQSPLLYGLAGTLGAARRRRAQDDAVLSGALDFKDVIKSVDQALNVWDFEPVMRTRVNAGHYAYMAQGADDFGTIAANRAGFKKIRLRPQRLVDVSKVDMTHGALRPEAVLADLPLPGRRAADVSSGGRGRRGARGENQEHAAGALDRHQLLRRGRDGRAGRTRLVSAVFHLRLADTLKQIKRAEARGLHGAGLDGGHTGAQPGADRAVRSRSRPAVSGLPRRRRRRRWRLRPMFDGIDMKAVRMGSSGLTWELHRQVEGTPRR